jgi:hypothetical protein
MIFMLNFSITQGSYLIVSCDEILNQASFLSMGNTPQGYDKSPGFEFGIRAYAQSCCKLTSRQRSISSFSNQFIQNQDEISWKID